jgi:GAF domain-containing protein
MSRSYFVDHRLHKGTHSPVDEFGPGVFQVDLGQRSAHEWQSDDYLNVPLIYGDGEFGWISVDDPADRQRPTLANVRALEIFADQAALIIHQARMLFQLRKQIARQKVLNELAHTITQHLELIELFPAVTRQLDQIFPFERISITLRDEQLSKARLLVEDVRGEIPPEMAKKPTALEQIAFDQIIRQNAPYHLVADLAGTKTLEDEQRQLQEEGIRSYTILPLKMWGRVIGALSLATETPGTFLPEDEDFLQQIAEHISGSLWNALLHEVEQKRRHIADALVELSKIINSRSTWTKCSNAHWSN